nr:heat shock chaperonin-binding [Tanacetum cinerariifolium]
MPTSSDVLREAKPTARVLGWMVTDVKKNIETVQGPVVYPAAQEVLIHNGKFLKDEKTLEENKVAANSSVMVVMLSKAQPENSIAPSTQPSPASHFAHTVTNLHGQAESCKAVGTDVESNIQHHLYLGRGKWDREMVTHALHATSNNQSTSLQYIILFSLFSRHNNPTKISPTIRSNQQFDPHIHSSLPRRCHHRPSASETKNKRRNITMAMVSAFTTIDKTTHNSRTTSRDLCLSFEKAYAPHSTSKEYTLKTQLLRIEMHGDETPDAYLNSAQEYANALTAIDEPVKDKDLVMLDVLGLREEYNGLKTTITVRQSSTAFSELHALLSDHDYMLEKTHVPAPSITSSFAANYAVGSPSMLGARQAQLSELTA